MNRHFSTERDHPCGACGFRATSIWWPVTRDCRTRLERGFNRRQLASEEMIYAQGAPGDTVYCLSRGLVALRSMRPDGHYSFVRLVRPGDIFGFRSFLEMQPHDTEARTLVASRVCVVAARDARAVVEGSPRVMGNLALRCAEELRRSRQLRAHSRRGDNRARLLRLIRDLSADQGPDPDGILRFRLPLSRADIAAALGLAPETVTRSLRRLSEAGALRISGRQVELPAQMVEQDA
ncbi:Crp/Fnr family transcriptional regulator [Jhaorihella thermophila]|uniref:CRP/FNR family transcriptional regulator, anaerobic regulatory protein n=1 Tax=Jhaorihella thermophila TaxID=488547 RepID=A0A1H5UQH6_9RHOB|nr:Crp/Fnr family transcriptional regulator [Jhaorihella thermophila]SEF76701.1 CRP/FNR family transcriptional regulator, anaerobic regulatory protein [Jhaorihella thermophila]